MATFLWLVAAGADKSAIESTVAAFKYGPFFFAVFLLLTMTSLAAHWYRKAAEADKNTYRFILIASFAAGLIAVGVSIRWWLVSRPKIYAYAASIKNLRDYETISADHNVYFWAEQTNLHPEVDDPTLLRHEHLVVLQDHPFEPGQTVQITLAKSQVARGTCGLPYLGDSEPAFIWVLDEKSQKMVLKPEIDTKASLLSFFVKSAFAAEVTSQAARPAAERAADIQQPKVPQASLSTECEPFADLAKADASVGARLVAADQVLAISDASARQCVRSAPQNLELVASVKGLTRHSDPELAAKAGWIADKIAWKEALVQGLGSSNAKTSQAAKAAVQDLEPSDAKQVLGDVSAGLTTPVPQEKPIPTGTNAGDRFYVRARWSAADPKAVDCLTRLFNSELQGRPSLQKEQEFMKNKTSRVVYSTAEPWAEHISAAIAGCGGTSSYVRF
ncbi:MAG TPA: hypothetical protein VH083_25710 [Myxococcales bacterium]|nr:hypothetical protein [Myxococcales bacterium]